MSGPRDGVVVQEVVVVQEIIVGEDEGWFWRGGTLEIRIFYYPDSWADELETREAAPGGWPNEIPQLRHPTIVVALMMMMMREA